MKLVKFMCTVNVIRARDEAKENEEDVAVIASHPMWVNPDDVQMIAPRRKDQPEEVSIFFRGAGGSTSVEGTVEEVIEKLTTA